MALWESNPLARLDTCLIASVVVFHLYWFAVLSYRFHNSSPAPPT